MTLETPAWQAGFAFHSPEQSPGFKLWRDFMRWQRGQNARLRPFGLTQPQFAILAVCGWLTRDDQQITQHNVVETLDLDRMHVSQITTRLERDGLINRTICPIDLRAKQISLTDKGKDLLRRTLPVVEGFDKAFFTSKDRSKDALNPAT
jgi:DNA-binding MarR family transcriptional regulator